MELNLLNLNPLIAVFDNFVPDEVIDHIHDAAEGNFQRAVVGASNSFASDTRTNSECFLRQRNDEVLYSLCKRIGDLIRFPPENAEPVAVLKYEPTQEYRPHFDAWNFTENDIPERLRKFGQRFFTSMVYLNDDFEGGATNFPRCEIAISPQRGRMILWSNTILGGNRPHANSLHAGEPVTKGEKWVATFFWVRRILPEPSILFSGP